MAIRGISIPAVQDGTPIELEGVIYIPRGKPTSAALVCHPHPLGGGSMDVPLVVIVAEELARAGMVVLRFNFRGVGNSGGEFSGGLEEMDDVEAAAELIYGQWGLPVSSTNLVGWSFGAAMCFEAVARGLIPRSLNLISLPLGMVRGSGSREKVSASGVPVRFYAGDADQLCPLRELEEFAEETGLDVEGSITVIPGSDHFLFGGEREVARVVLEGIRLQDM